MSYYLMAAWMQLAPLAAEAPAEKSSGGSPLPTSLLLMVAVFFIFYFLMIRPQQKRQRQIQDMRTNLAKGNHIVTTGGIRGVITLVRDHEVVVKVDDNVKLTLLKSGVARVLSDTDAKGGAEDSSKR